MTLYLEIFQGFLIKLVSSRIQKLSGGKTWEILAEKVKLNRTKLSKFAFFMISKLLC